MKNLILILLLSVSCVISAKFRFDDYTLYKVLPENEEHIKVLKDLYEEDLRFDFWTFPHISADFVNILSSPEYKEDLKLILKNNKINYEIAMLNVQEAIDKEVVSRYSRSNNRTMQWNAYYNLEDINAWMADLVATYPRITSTIVGGRSYEGRNITGIKISHGSGRKAIFVEGGLHAREWITTTCVCYIINELLTNNNTETIAAARDYDWYIFPVTNPDGYVWSHDQFRMWRKNRRPIVGQIYGVDLNRNWNNNWLVTGASTNPASEVYAGPGPFSEPETRSLSAYLRTIRDKMDMYLSYHSFGQLLLIPFGNTTEPLANYHDAINIGRRAMGAMSVRFGTQYITGNIAEAIYMASGGSVDWVKEHLQTPLVYCYELRDRGQYGFLLPVEQILPNNLETMDSVLELLHQAKRFGYLLGSPRTTSDSSSSSSSNRRPKRRMDDE